MTATQPCIASSGRWLSRLRRFLAAQISERRFRAKPALQAGRTQLALEAESQKREERFTALYDDHHYRVWCYIARRVRGHTEIDDLAHETFVIAWRCLEDIRTDDPIPWLLTTARYLVLNHIRKHAGRAGIDAGIAADPTSQRQYEETPEDRIVEKHLLAEALACLAEGDREILGLAEWDGLSVKEIATIMGISKRAASTRLHRARRRLQHHYCRLST